jgi:hypothetical protein
VKLEASERVHVRGHLLAIYEDASWSPPPQRACSTGTGPSTRTSGLRQHRLECTSSSRFSASCTPPLCLLPPHLRSADRWAPQPTREFGTVIRESPSNRLECSVSVVALGLVSTWAPVDWVLVWVGSTLALACLEARPLVGLLHLGRSRTMKFRL